MSGIDLIQTLLTILCSVLASSGVWAVVLKLMDRKDVKTQMLIGLGHDRIMYLATAYINRGSWITTEEYENLVDYLYKPYEAMGGNGSAKRLVDEIKKMDIKPNDYVPQKEVEQ
ncbi:MAG: hypothetical protein IKW90_15070 [Lachnospiraceae bacterium]|nr:hypothetical protein [Lachnospiraceae bacterium]